MARRNSVTNMKINKNECVEVFRAYGHIGRDNKDINSMKD